VAGDYGGGWSQLCRRRESQLVKIPPELGDEEAVLIEPLAVGLRGVLRRPPKGSEKALVVGAGIIGLTTLMALRALFPESRVYCLARHPFQSKLAERLGADVIREEGDVWAEVGRAVDARILEGRFGNRMMRGGFDVIYDCVGNDHSLRNALRWARPRGSVVVIGVNLCPRRLDYTPIWHREVDLLGSMAHGTEEYECRRISTFDMVIELLRSGRYDVEGLITHRFRLEDYRSAIRAASDKAKSGAVKVTLEPTNTSA